MASRNSLSQIDLPFFFSFIDSCDLQSSSLVAREWCSLSNSKIHEISLNPFVRGIPKNQKELKHLLERFPNIRSLKIMASEKDFKNGLLMKKKGFKKGLCVLVPQITKILASILEYYSESLENLEVFWDIGCNINFLDRQFSNLKSLKFYSRCGDNLKFLINSPHIEVIEYTGGHEDTISNFTTPFLEELAIKPNFQNLRSLNMQTMIQVRFFSNVLENCPLLEEIKLTKLHCRYSFQEEIMGINLLSPLQHLHTFDVTFMVVSISVTDDIMRSLSCLLPNVRKFHLGVSDVTVQRLSDPAIVRFVRFSDYGIQLLSDNCRFLEKLQLRLPSKATGEGFLNGFPNLKTLSLGKEFVFGGKREKCWESIKRGCPKLENGFFSVMDQPFEGRREE